METTGELSLLPFDSKEDTYELSQVKVDDFGCRWLKQTMTNTGLELTMLLSTLATDLKCRI